MDIPDQLFTGKRIRLAPIDHEKDPPVVSRWTHDFEYLRMLSTMPARPLSPERIKKQYEQIEKDMEEGNNLVHFAIRLLPKDGEPEERLIGFARLQWIEWGNRNAWISLGIGDARDRGCGYGTEALRLLLRYSFHELSLYRVSAGIQEINTAAMRLFKKAGFVEETRRRQAVYRDGVRSDLVHMGLLYEEWQDR